MARPRKRSTPTPPAPEAAAAGNGAEQLLGPVALASPDPAATDWIPMWGPTPNTLPQDTVIAAATRIIANRLVNTDANAAWQVRGDGRMDWGAGGGAAYDTNLYRSSAGRLQTDGAVWVGSSVVVDLASNNGTGRIYFGTALDCSIYRVGAGNIKTDQSLYIGGGVVVGNSGSGQLYWGSSLDATLYRNGANSLYTPGSLNVAGGVYSNSYFAARATAPQTNTCHLEGSQIFLTTPNVTYSFAVAYNGAYVPCVKLGESTYVYVGTSTATNVRFDSSVSGWIYFISWGQQ